jgi:hypothetical protein
MGPASTALRLEKATGILTSTSDQDLQIVHHPSDSLYGNATAWGLIAAKHDHGAQRALFLSLELFTLCSILSLECFARSAVAENVALRDENEIAVAHAKADLIRALSSVL